MKQMTTRRLAALGLAAAMGLTLAACGEQQPSPGGGGAGH